MTSHTMPHSLDANRDPYMPFEIDGLTHKAIECTDSAKDKIILLSMI